MFGAPSPRRKRTKGFTLIELLVVIAIIGVLSSVVLSSLNVARVKARDARRLSDLYQIHLALELYYDANGTYPRIGPWVYSCDSSWSTLQTALAPYMKSVPTDPINAPCNGPWNTGYYSYAYGTNDGVTYDLVAQFENRSNPQRCELRQWTFYIIGSSWCGSYSLYLFADH